MKEFGKIKDHYDFTLDSRQLGLVLFGAFVFVVIIFVLGMSVGRQWEGRRQADARPATPPEPQPAANQAVTPPAPPAMPAVAPPVAPPVAAPEPLNTTVSPGQAPAPAYQQQPISAEKSESAAHKKMDTLTFPKVLTSSSRNTTPLEPEKRHEGVKDEATGGYSVQVGAFNDRKEAQSRADKLKKKGYDAKVTGAKAKNGKTLYKVRVGSFSTKDKALAMAGRLESGEGLTPYITEGR